MSKQQEEANFTFGELSFRVRNPKGYFVMSDGLKQRIASLPLASAKKANAEAWTLRRKCERIMNRYNNATLYPGIYDSVAGSYGIAESVCKETFKRMKAAA